VKIYGDRPFLVLSSTFLSLSLIESWTFDILLIGQVSADTSTGFFAAAASTLASASGETSSHPQTLALPSSLLLVLFALEVVAFRVDCYFFNQFDISLNASETEKYERTINPPSRLPLRQHQPLHPLLAMRRIPRIHLSACRLADHGYPIHHPISCRCVIVSYRLSCFFPGSQFATVRYIAASRSKKPTRNHHRYLPSFLLRFILWRHD